MQEKNSKNSAKIGYAMTMQKTIIHKELAAGKWRTLSLMEQLANVGSDVIRAIKWKNKGEQVRADRAIDRALELLDLTINDPKNWGHRLKELGRCRECLVDYFVYDNEYGSSDKLWETYFLFFNFVAARERGR